MSRARRWYAPAVLALLAGGGLTFVTMTQTWGSAVLSAPGLPEDEIAVTGAEAMPAVSALGLVVLASALGVLAGSRRVRRVLGALVLLIALGCAAWIAIGSGAAIESALAAAAEESATFTGRNAPEAIAVSAWRLATAAALLLAAAGAVLIVTLAPAWPTMSSRYEAPGARREEDEQDMWKAFDEGRDPTE